MHILTPLLALLHTFTPDSTHCYTRVEPGTHARALLNYSREADGGAIRCLTVSRGTGLITGLSSGGDESADGSRGELGGKGRYAFPGFWDGHGHVLQYGEMLGSVKLYGAESIEEVRTRIKDYRRLHPGSGTRDNWIRGLGWDQRFWGGVMPTAKQLDDDPALKGLYIMLDRIDVHCTWVSEAVLSLLPNPLPHIPGGDITTDPGPGVFCDNAMDLPLAVFPAPTPSAKKAMISAAAASLHSLGIVGVHDAGVTPEDLQLFRSMPGLTLRHKPMLECATRNTFCTPPAGVTAVKLFADGALGSHGAALLEPYTDAPHTTGTLLVPAATLHSVATSWYNAGIQVHIHAIGDLANRVALSTFRDLLASNCPPPDYVSSPSHQTSQQLTCMRHTQTTRRLRLEHAQILHPDDQALLADLGIIASMQPAQALSDTAIATARLGASRLSSRGYRLAHLARAGAPMVLGSDFPVESPDVIAGMAAAVEVGLSIGQAGWGFTGAVAWGGFDEGVFGVLQVGAGADWVVLDGDLADGPAGVKVLETWVGGRRVWCAECSGGWWRWGLRVERVLGEVERVLGGYGL